MFKFLSILSLILLAFISCSETEKIVEPPDQLVYQFDDYIHFDTIGGYLVAKSQDSNYAYPEIFLSWEQSIGEPFTDMNGNGIYDMGIDIFIRSAGSDNMDLNRDGRYTGPNDPWEPGIPYDDINGDGLCQHYRHYDMHRSYYTGGFPYFDLNKNGKWDSYQNYGRSAVKCSTSTLNLSKTYSFKFVETSYKFISDSNLIYWVPVNNVIGFRNEFIKFIITDSASLELQVNANFRTLTFETFSDVSNITSDSSYIFIDDDLNVDSLFKEVILEEQIEYNGISYSDILLIRYSGYDDYLKSELSLELYFSKDFGLVKLGDNYSDNYNGSETKYFIDRLETIPQMLTR